ncbi:MAG: ferredoxin [Cypionkella sp.]|nr:ferredoxin [Cypionkella sp.]
MAKRGSIETRLEPDAAVSPRTLSQIAALAAQRHLAILGGFHADDNDNLPKGTQTLLMLGAAEPGFWAHFTAQPEWGGGAPDPMDRWSRRVIGRMACDLGAKALFPFGGPPYHPFYAWALRTGRVWQSPIKLLVHAQQGLMVSFRGAIALPARIDLPPAAPRPCDSCAAPCKTTCPALGAAGYDLAACHALLDGGKDCMKLGCAARRACPVAAGYARLPEHSSYHMRQFHR